MALFGFNTPCMRLHVHHYLSFSLPDACNLGFLTQRERLNVLLSGQEQFLAVVGDMHYSEYSTEPATTTETDEDAAGGDEKTWGRNDRKNAFVMKVLMKSTFASPVYILQDV